MKIKEIFYSIQGEGKWTGLPNIFIRTAGCNLRCSYCDTKYAYKDGNEMTNKQIIDKIEEYPCKKICITGGEPLLQKDVEKLIDELIKKNYQVSIETNGSIDIKSLSKKTGLMISLDIKCPSSKMHNEMNNLNIYYLEEKDQLKFVIKDKKDYKYAKDIIENYKPKCDVFFQPVWGTNPIYLSDWIIDDDLNVKLGLQLHKIIWGEKQGI
jgi:7-carboxy-7-deazaguanine synthase